jgi:glycosyltransferase involved in cell wall biosynthesis
VGWQSEIVTLDNDGEPWEQEFPVPVHALGSGCGTYGYSPRLIKWLRAEAGRFDAIIVDGLWQFTSLAVWLALRGGQTPYYVFTHGMLDPWVKYKHPLKHLKKWLYWPWAEYRVLRDAQAVLFTTEEERKLARESFWLYSCTEAVVGYGTEDPLGDPVHQRKVFENTFPEIVGKRNILFVGRIHPVKACDLIIEAFAYVARAHADVHLIVAGPDTTQWTEKLRALSNRKGVGNRITWTGSISGDLKWGAFHCADAFIHPSHQENFGVAIAEALACGVPVLISNKVNIYQDIVVSGGGLVAEDNLEGVVSLLDRWLNEAAVNKAKMRKAARDCFLRNFDVNIAASKIAVVLQKTVLEK